MGGVADEIDPRASESSVFEEDRERDFVGQSQKQEGRGHNGSHDIGADAKIPQPACLFADRAVLCVV